MYVNVQGIMENYMIVMKRENSNMLNCYINCSQYLPVLLRMVENKTLSCILCGMRSVYGMELHLRRKSRNMRI